MGQAKRNGTFEDRKSKAIEREKAKEQAYRDAWKAKWDAMTPEEQAEYKKQEHEKRMSVARIHSLVNMFSGSHYL